jgi:3-hydroxyisobutyrate dehydrogenase
MTQPAVGFIGTGVMGASMAGNLLAAGHPVFVFNRSSAKAEALLAKGATWCDTPAQVARKAGVVITIVGTPDDVRSVYLGREGLIENSASGAILIDMTTSDPELAAQLASTGAQRSVSVLDAPVSGGDIGARNGTLSIMVGGAPEAFERALPIFQRMGKTIVLQGPAGSGQYTKLCNQVAIASTMLSVCESMALAQASGLDPTRVLESITTGAANSWPLANLMPRALRGDFEPGFAVNHLIKDLDIALRCAERLKLDFPGLALARRLYGELSEQGAGAKGTQALFRRYVERRPAS